MKRLTLLALVLAAGAVSAAPKADAEKGKQVATTICAACHAADGNSGIATYPKLAGQAAAYTYGQTMAIKDGTRTHRCCRRNETDGDELVRTRHPRRCRLLRQTARQTGRSQS